MDSSLAAEIIEEIVESCITIAMPEKIDTIECGNAVTAVEQIDNNKVMVMQVNKDMDAEVEIIDQMEALENDCEPADDDDIGSTGDECAEQNVSSVETNTDTKLSSSSGFKPLREARNVLKATEVDLLRSKGFCFRTLESFVKVCNLSVLQNSIYLTKHEVKCENFPGKMAMSELISLFEKCGPIAGLRRSTNKTLIVVTFISPEDAERAVESFNRRKVNGHVVRVSRCLPETRLIVFGISSSATRHELFKRFSAATQELQSVHVFNDPMCESKIRRFCYLLYSSWEKAVDAMKRLSKMLPPNMYVDWPRQRFIWTKTPDTLYIDNIRSSVREADLKRLFSIYGPIISVKQSGFFARIQFSRVEDATRAAREIDRRQLGNENVEIRSVELSQKRSDRSGYRNYRPSFSVKCDQNTRPSSSDTLYLKNLRSTISVIDLRKTFSVYGKVMSVDKENDSASVRFCEEEVAERAAQSIDRRRLGDNVHISLVDQSNISDTLYIYNLFADMTTKELRAIFSVHGEVLDVDLRDDFAVIRFRNKDESERAVQRIDRRQLGKPNVEILFFAKKTR